MAKYTCSLILWEHDTNTKNQHPIYLKVTINRQTKYLATGYHILKKLWDTKNESVRTSAPNADLINADISDRKQKAIKYIVEANMRGEYLTASHVKEAFTGRRNLHNYFEFVDGYIQECRTKRDPSTLENYRKHAAKLELFYGGRGLSFEQIDSDFLLKFEKFLVDDSLSINYIHALLKTMRTMFNAARKKGVVKIYPFSQYEMVRYRAPKKDYLNFTELDLMEEFADTVKDTVLKQTAVYFLLGCYSGLRVSDWYQFSIKDHIREGRLFLRAEKNGEWVTMPILGRLKRNMDRMRKVPLQIQEPTLNEKLKVIANELKLNKRITTHCGRHTFAITMCAEQGISSETCAALMGITVTTCIENYYKVTPHKIYNEASKAWDE